MGPRWRLPRGAEAGRLVPRGGAGGTAGDAAGVAQGAARGVRRRRKSPVAGLPRCRQEEGEAGDEDCGPGPLCGDKPRLPARRWAGVGVAPEAGAAEVSEEQEGGGGAVRGGMGECGDRWRLRLGGGAAGAAADGEEAEGAAAGEEQVGAGGSPSYSGALQVSWRGPSNHLEGSQNLGAPLQVLLQLGASLQHWRDPSKWLERSLQPGLERALQPLGGVPPRLGAVAPTERSRTWSEPSNLGGVPPSTWRGRSKHLEGPLQALGGAPPYKGWTRHFPALLEVV